MPNDSLAPNPFSRMDTLYHGWNRYLWQFLIGPEALVPGALHPPRPRSPMASLQLQGRTRTIRPYYAGQISSASKTRVSHVCLARPTSQQQHDAEAPR
eukprot:47209-Eustigmatos_ZCMA.PRE.1